MEAMEGEDVSASGSGGDAAADGVEPPGELRPEGVRRMAVALLIGIFRFYFANL